uniref:Thioredoxin domain-containing protein n=1 Tax=Arcella intermedia TaxID=1963864 RepID=A0A6B2KZE9_9EUKA
MKDLQLNAKKEGDQLLVKEFPSDLEWLNSKPLGIASHLKGKIVLLDFWTFCCINCLHVLPFLKELEAQYSNEPIVFIGVHSAKFENERNTDAIRNAILKNGIHHPVINDYRMEMWKHMRVSGWPSFAILNPYGELIYLGMGETSKTMVKVMLEASLSVYKEALSHHKIELELEKDKVRSDSQTKSKTQLSYPGKVYVHAETQRLFISDSSNNRVLIFQLQNEENNPKAYLLHEIGSGDANFNPDQQTFNNCSFNNPQGLYYDYDQDVIYLADTDNHCLKAIDLNSFLVKTIAGIGTQGNDYVGGKTSGQELNSPWDICKSPKLDALYVAMAGQHQIWLYNLKTHISHNFAGIGSESSGNSKDLLKSTWAQPSGVCLDNNEECLFIADAESSKIRGIKLKEAESVTFVGGNEVDDDLKAFGDMDGEGKNAKLQHPLAVCWIGDSVKGYDVVVSDTYNHKIKLLSSSSRSIKTWSGSTKGMEDGDLGTAKFNEPSGLSFDPANERIYVSDTNNHSIRRIDIKTGKVQTVSLEFNSKLFSINNSIQNNQQKPFLPETKELDGGTLKISPNTKTGKIRVRLNLPKTAHLNLEAVSLWQLITPYQSQSPSIFSKITKTGIINQTDIIIPYQLQSNNWSSEKCLLELLIYKCTDTDGTCEISQQAIQFSIQPNDQQTQDPQLFLQIP